MADIDLSAFTDIAPLGSGGLGDVYRATRASTGGTVAIKVLRDWSDVDVAWQRAQRELRALVDLRGHANVVNVEEVIESEGTLAIVMEFAPGGSVSDLMRERGGHLDFPEALLVGTHTAAALAASHELGIIHRDIKPHNLLIGAFGQVKVCDFGIASLSRSEEVSNRTSSLSLRYASPEELRGDASVGPPADVYSLAATLHQILTGQYLPQPDGTAGSLPLRAWTAPDDLPADVEVEFRELVVRSADRNPDRRPTAVELHDGFESLAVRLGPARCRALPSVAKGPLETPTVPGVSIPGAITAAAAVTTVAAVLPGDPAVASTVPVDARAASTMVGYDASDGAAVTTPVDQPMTPDDPGVSRSTVIGAAFAALSGVLVLGGIGWALGWFGGSESDVDAGAVVSAPAVATIATVPVTVTTVPPPTTPAPTMPASPTTTDVTDTTTSATTLPPRYAAPNCPGTGACISMDVIRITEGTPEYEIEWTSNFAPSTGDVHAHFFWDIYDAAQVGSASADQAPWELTDQQPFTPADEMRLTNRPAEATGICVTPADLDHAVIDPAYFHCALVPASQQPGVQWDVSQLGSDTG